MNFKIQREDGKLIFASNNTIITFLSTNMYYPVVLELVKDLEEFTFDDLENDLQSKLITCVDYADEVEDL